MLVPVYLALFLGALGAAKYALIDRRAPLTTMPASMVFFAAFAIGSFSVEPLTGGDPRSLIGMFALGLGGVLFMVAMLILEALDKLPDHPVEAVFGNDNPAVRSGPPGPEQRENPKRGD
ncbi:hypothetical protein [Halolamina salifodinae]|uniref:Uncharacterized protein n=1 Tax=Halolamina salifodinae TaxID=1202767 RepID=A0A8T4GWG7_9EURY|nr:hypothetical protein [Halolamina salifodinae]MBP1987239.1 hypothetical protein [Halolamina salifodinae]